MRSQPARHGSFVVVDKDHSVRGAFDRRVEGRVADGREASGSDVQVLRAADVRGRAR